MKLHKDLIYNCIYYYSSFEAAEYFNRRSRSISPTRFRKQNFLLFTVYVVFLQHSATA